MDDEDGGLFAIEISEDESEKPQKPTRRTEQNEEEFQIVKDSYRTKIENGNVSCVSWVGCSPSEPTMRREGEKMEESSLC